jgi:hypothetical protein
VKEAGKHHGVKGVRRMIAQTYREATGKPLPKVAGAEVRNLVIQAMADQETERYSGREARVVNPPKLIEALQHH